MRPFKAAQAPFLVFGVAAIAFVSWLTYDASHAPAAARSHSTSTSARSPDDDPDAGPIEDRLSVLCPGQTRLAIEKYLAELMVPQVDPIDISSGKPVLREHYHVHLNHTVPNIPLAHSEEFSPGSYVLTVEFDGSSHGHPLSRLALAPAPWHPKHPLPTPSPTP